MRRWPMVPNEEAARLASTPGTALSAAQCLSLVSRYSGVPEDALRIRIAGSDNSNRTDNIFYGMNTHLLWLEGLNDLDNLPPDAPVTNLDYRIWPLTGQLVDLDAYDTLFYGGCCLGVDAIARGVSPDKLVGLGMPTEVAETWMEQEDEEDAVKAMANTNPIPAWARAWTEVSESDNIHSNTVAEACAKINDEGRLYGEDGSSDAYPLILKVAILAPLFASVGRRLTYTPPPDMALDDWRAA